MIAVSWGETTLESTAVIPLPRSIKTIIAEVAIKYDITLAQIMGNRKARKFSEPRQEAMWRCYRETGATLPQIARAIGKKDHSTVWYGVKAYESRLKRREDLLKKIDQQP